MRHALGNNLTGFIQVFLFCAAVYKVFNGVSLELISANQKLST